MPVNERLTDYLQHLQEILLSDIDPNGVSNLTKKHYDKRMAEGNSGIVCISAHLDYPSLFEIGFEVESSFGDTQQTSAGGQNIGGYDAHYTSYLSFSDLDTFMTPDFLSLTPQAQEQQLQDVFNNCDLKVYCNCPAFYWQGMAEDLDKKGGLMMKYIGQSGKGIWRGRHQSSGGLKDPMVRVCKHLYEVAEDLDGLIPDILSKLSGGTNLSKSKKRTQNMQKPAPTTPVNEVPEDQTDFPETDDEGQPQRVATPDPTKITATGTTDPNEQAPEEVNPEHEEQHQTDNGTQADMTKKVAGDEDEPTNEDTNQENVDPADAVKVIENQEDDIKDAPLEDNVSEFQEDDR